MAAIVAELNRFGGFRPASPPTARETLSKSISGALLLPTEWPSAQLQGTRALLVLVDRR